jgi:alpha-galactosidase
MKKNSFFFAFILSVVLGHTLSAQVDTVYLSDLDLTTIKQGWGKAVADKGIDGRLLSIAGKQFRRGVSTHAKSMFRVRLSGKAQRFMAYVGIDDDAIGGIGGSSFFYVYGDDSLLWKSDLRRTSWIAQKCDVSVQGFQTLILKVDDGGDGIDYDHADWADAKLVMKGGKPQAFLPPVEAPYILTPKTPPVPRINGAKIFGVRPGSPFLYTIAATGERPMGFSAKNLPKGLSLDHSNGKISGVIEKAGAYRVTLRAQNSLGRTERELRIVVGKTIALTPPLGWNSWNCFACDVDDAKIRAAADALVKSGLIDHGWSYINIDDCWAVKPGSNDALLSGALRDKSGGINTNKKFPDMNSLSEYVHGKGLKLGIYSSPGTTTCADFTASYGHEEQDARRFGEWNIDYLKYDWCSYGKIAKDKNLVEYKKPYQVMRAALDKVPRDIVFSLCQYGMGDVWTWGESVGGNCWRTTGDINDTWGSVEDIGFQQTGKEAFAGPGHWNDPDMLVVGYVGWGPDLHQTQLSPNEQYTHISLWALLSAPPLIGCDMTKLDDFTLNLLTNDEVLDVNQDALGKQARRVMIHGDLEVWAKELEDGSKAVGLFNRSEKTSPVDVRWSDLGIKGKKKIRDIWRQKDLGVFSNHFVADVPSHGAVLVKVLK